MDYSKTIFSLRAIFEIIFALIFILVIIYLIKKLYYFKKRQKKTYELQDEDFDYFPNINKNKNNYDINKNLNNSKILIEPIIEMRAN